MTTHLKFLPSAENQNINRSNHSIYFMHIPKCGGTTIDQIFYKLSLVLNTFRFKRFGYGNNGKMHKFILPKINEDIPNFISGHLDYNFSDKIHNLYKCTIVRKPQERILSHYKFKLVKLRKTPLSYNFETFINEEIKKSRDNLVTRHFSGLLNIEKKIDESDKNQALNNVNYFDNINVFDNWDFFVSELLSDFGLPSVFYSKFQETKNNFKYEFNKKDLNLIYENYEYDIELYEEINKKSKNKSTNKTLSYNKKICIVSPFIKTEHKLFNESEIKELFKK